MKLKWGGRRRPDVTAIKAPVLLSKAKQDGLKGRPPRVEKRNHCGGMSDAFVPLAIFYHFTVMLNVVAKCQ